MGTLFSPKMDETHSLERKNFITCHSFALPSIISAGLRKNSTSHPGTSTILQTGCEFILCQYILEDFD
jgi:hypothetical protein